MKSAVAAAFVAFSTKFEGALPYLYLDCKALVTTAIGNLVDPVEEALRLPLLHEDDTPASKQDIFAEWTVVKARRDLAPCGGMAFHKITKLHLSPEGLESVVLGKLETVDAYMGQRWPEYETWPADGQLGVLSMAWAMGSAFYFPHFSAAVRVQDFATAATECKMDATHNPGLRPRNEANAILFQNAAAVLASGADPYLLRWPERFLSDPDAV